MKVAIIGAGLAGLSCAHELEMHGISPVLYERNSYIGDQISHVGALLEIIDRPMKNVLNYVSSNYGIKVTPLNTLNTLTHYSPNIKTVIKGNLGYFIERGSNEDSIFRQLYSQLKNPQVNLCNAPDIDRLSRENDYVVVANGNATYSEAMGCWQSWLNTYLRGAIIQGSFNPHELIVWINKEYCKRGYAYLSPFSEKKASIILIVSDINEKEVDHYWELFLTTERIECKIVEEFKLAHQSGLVYPLKVGNILFAGNAGGSIDPFLGFGIFNSISMGVKAAQSIVYNQDYEILVSSIKNKNLDMLQFRKLYDILSNTGYDLLISSIGLPGIKHIAYYTPLNVVKLGASIIRLLLPTKLP